MDNISYLNQISMTDKPKSSGSFFENKKFRLFIIIAAALIIISIAFGIVMSIMNRETDYLPRLNLRVKNVSSVITNYNSQVKSSSLRAAGASLSSVLDNMSTNLPAYINPEYQIPESVTSEEDATLSAIKTSLDNAKINGLLDRAYARQMTYAINILLSLIDEASENSKNDSAKAFLNSSANSLNLILPAFSDF